MGISLIENREKCSKQKTKISDAIALFSNDIAKKTGLSKDEIETTTLHKIEESRSITIKKPRRTNLTRIGYHRSPHSNFITPQNRESIIKQFDKDFNFSLNGLIDKNREG